MLAHNSGSVPEGIPGRFPSFPDQGSNVGVVIPFSPEPWSPQPPPSFPDLVSKVGDVVPLSPEPWPPQPPDMSGTDAQDLIEPEHFAFSSTQIYKFKDGRKVYKFRGSQHEYDMMIAAGDCSVKVYGRVLYRAQDFRVWILGYIMDLETPLDVKTMDVSQKKIVMEQMISVVLALHEKGIIHGDVKPANMLLCSDGKLRLCDFQEARMIDDDPDEYEGLTTDNYLSPYRARYGSAGGEPPPTVEDDLYGVGVSIWELYTGKIPFENEYIDDILDTLQSGQTVDVNEVEDESVRAIICKYLRYGGAKL